MPGEKRRLRKAMLKAKQTIATIEAIEETKMVPKGDQ